LYWGAFYSVGGTPAAANFSEVIGLAVLLVRATFSKNGKYKKYVRLQKMKDLQSNWMLLKKQKKGE
jgi:hypothetical protein